MKICIWMRARCQNTKCLTSMMKILEKALVFYSQLRIVEIAAERTHMLSYVFIYGAACRRCSCTWALKAPCGGWEMSSMMADNVAIIFFSPHLLTKDVFHAPTKSLTFFYTAVCPQSSSCNTFCPPLSLFSASSVLTSILLRPWHKRSLSVIQ